MQGVVPSLLDKEITKQFGPQVEEVGIFVRDCSSHDYNNDTPTFQFSTSQGKSLLDSTTRANEESVGRQVRSAFHGAVPRALHIDSQTPNAVVVQIVLANRSRHRVYVIPTTTIFELYQHTMSLSDVATCDFQLVSGFPPTPLLDPNATVAS
uniref:Acetate kinase n=1 Tax=Lygus hesperus TaxID=30085 RepID=A0A0A9Y2J9_LYGHE